MSLIDKLNKLSTPDEKRQYISYRTEIDRAIIIAIIAFMIILALFVYSVLSLHVPH